MSKRILSTPKPYTAEFFSEIRSGSQQSAKVLLPLVVGLLHPNSVIDVGCGDGSWLAVFHQLGVTDTLGIDGEYVNGHLLQIPQDQFRAVDLSEPFRIERFFDLAMSLEVAEHLLPHRASDFVESITRLAPVVLFSAAIPFQGGKHHQNEQWPDYWAALFKRHNYLPIDCIRGQVWHNNDVEWWYAQNSLLFASTSRIENDPVLLREYEKTNPQQICLVHPKKHLAVAQPGVKAALRLLGQALKRSVRWRTRFLTRRKPDA